MTRMTIGHDDPIVQEVLDTWTPRFLNGGIPIGDLEATVARIGSWDEWPAAWMETAAVHEARAREAEEAGHRLTATDAWLTASRCHHVGYFVATRDPELHERGLSKMLDTHERARPYLTPAMERIDVPTADDLPAMVALLTVPPGVDRPPVVILLPGLDSTKETRQGRRAGWLRRGMAVMTLDGPGQGEASRWSTIRPDYERAVGAAIDYLETRDDIDATRVAIVGSSLGGYYAPRAVAFESRVTACVANCGPFDFSEAWDVAPQVTREAFIHYSGAADEADARRRAAELNLEGVAQRITIPLLVVHGKADPLIPWDHGRRLAEAASGPTEFVLVEGGNHGVNNLSYRWVPKAQDWVADHLGAGG